VRPPPRSLSCNVGRGHFLSGRHDNLLLAASSIICDLRVSLELDHLAEATMQASLDDHARHRRDSHGSSADRESIGNEDDQESLHALLSDNECSFEREGENVFPRVVEHTKWWKIYFLYYFFMWNTRTFEYVSVRRSPRVSE